MKKYIATLEAMYFHRYCFHLHSVKEAEECCSDSTLCCEQLIRFPDTCFLLEIILSGGVKDNRSLFFETIGYCFYCSFYCFVKILGGQKPFRWVAVESQETWL